MIKDVQLIRSFMLNDYPSGSSINYRNGKLYVIGDDATTILVLDGEYKQLDSLPILNYPSKRIPKPIKPDMEASAFISIRGQEMLLIIGSASTKQREKIFIIPLLPSGLNMIQCKVFNDGVFIDRLRMIGIDEVNIEGVTVVGNRLILSNRGNRKNITNHLLLTEIGFWERQADVNLSIVAIEIALEGKEFPGISDMCYLESTDTLLVMFSTELTYNAYDDGAIGNSYMGCINNFTTKVKLPALKIDQIINLTDIHSDFKNEKIEGICVESVVGNKFTLHLVSDNDKGQSKLFKVSLEIKDL